MPRKDKTAIPWEIASSIKPSTTESSVPPGARKGRPPKQTVTITDTNTFRRKRGGIQQEEEAASVETKDDMIRRRVGVSIFHAIYRHSRLREEAGGEADWDAVHFHDEAIAATIRNYPDNVSLVVPENSACWGCKAYLTNDEEKYYPNFFSVHCVPWAEKSSTQAEKETIDGWEQGNSVFITSELSVKSGSKKQTVKAHMTVGSGFEIAKASHDFWDNRRRCSDCE